MLKKDGFDAISNPMIMNYIYIPFIAFIDFHKMTLTVFKIKIKTIITGLITHF